MKHFIMLLCGVVLPFFASAQEFAFQGLKFKVTDATKKTCQLAGFEAGEIAALSIPSVATNGGVDYTVTSIADQAFFYSGIRSLTIPNTVLSIGEFAFCWCTSLSEVNFGECFVKLLQVQTHVPDKCPRWRNRCVSNAAFCLNFGPQACISCRSLVSYRHC